MQFLEDLADADRIFPAEFTGFSCSVEAGNSLALYSFIIHSVLNDVL